MKKGEINIAFAQAYFDNVEKARKHTKKAAEDIIKYMKEISSIKFEGSTQKEFIQNSKKATQALIDQERANQALLRTEQQVVALLAKESRALIAEERLLQTQNKTLRENTKEKERQIDRTNRLNKQTERETKARKKRIARIKRENDAYGKLSKEKSELARKSKRIGAILIYLEKTGRKNTRTFNELADAYTEVTLRVSGLDKQLKRLDSNVGQNTRKVGAYENAVSKLKVGFRELAGAFGVVSAIMLFADALRAGLDVIVEFDKQLIAVGKTTGVEGKKLEELGNQVVELGVKTAGVQIDGLLKSAEVAGQLGIKGSENILKFAKTIEQLKLTSDVAGEESVRNFAKFINVSKDSVENADRLGSVVTRLGNNFSTTESQVISSANEIQTALSKYNASAESVLALGAATSSLGLQSEKSRSAIQDTFIILDKAVRKGENLEQVLKLTGLTQGELSDQFNKDATGVFVRLVKGLDGVISSGGSLNDTLEDLGLDAKRADTVLSALAGRSDLLSDAVSQANEEYQLNIALEKEAGASAQSLASKWGDLKDIVKASILDFEDGNGILSDLAKLIIDILIVYIQEFRELWGDIGEDFEEITKDIQKALSDLGIEWDGQIALLDTVRLSVKLVVIPFELLAKFIKTITKIVSKLTGYWSEHKETILTLLPTLNLLKISFEIIGDVLDTITDKISMASDAMGFFTTSTRKSMKEASKSISDTLKVFENIQKPGVAIDFSVVEKLNQDLSKNQDDSGLNIENENETKSSKTNNKEQYTGYVEQQVRAIQLLEKALKNSKTPEEAAKIQNAIDGIRESIEDFEYQVEISQQRLQGAEALKPIGDAFNVEGVDITDRLKKTYEEAGKLLDTEINTPVVGEDEDTESKDLEEKLVKAEQLKVISDVITDNIRKMGLGAVADEFTNLFEEILKEQSDFADKFAAGFALAGAVVNEVFNSQSERRIAQLELEGEKSAERTDNEISRIEREIDALNSQGELTEDQLKQREALEGEIVAKRNQEERKQSQIKRKQYKAEQEAQVRMALINGAVAATKALATLGPILGPPAALSQIIAAGVQAAFISSQKIPEFWIGTDNAPEGWAKTDERGAEIHTDKYGNIKDLGSDKGARYKYLNEGDKIIPAHKTKQLLQSNLFEADQLTTSLALNSLRVPDIKVENHNNGVTKEEMYGVFSEALKNNIPTNRYKRNGYEYSESPGEDPVRGNRVEETIIIVDSRSARDKRRGK